MEHFKLSRSDAGYFFGLIARNYKNIGQSEIYETMAGAENGIESVRVNSQIDDRYENRTSKTSTRGKFYFVLKGGNGEVILLSETYYTRFGRMMGKAAVKRCGATKRTLYENIVIGVITPTVEKLEAWISSNGLFRENYRAINQYGTHVAGHRFDKIVKGLDWFNVPEDVVNVAKSRLRVKDNGDK